MLFGSSSSPTKSDEVFPASVRFVFVAGWDEETFIVSHRRHHFVASTTRAVVSGKFLFESQRGDALFMEQSLGTEQIAEFGSGVLLKAHDSVDPTALAREFMLNASDKLLLVRVVSTELDAEVEAITLAKHFPSSNTIPATLITCGNWLQRPLPFPLQNVTADEMASIRHIFAYGTLRHDDTSGASWTIPFNEDMTSEAAIIRGVSLYLQSYAILLIPRHEDHANEGVVGCVVTTDNGILFSQKLEMTDRIEGSPSLYRRGVVRAETRSGQTVLAFVYYRTLQQVGGDTFRFLRSRIESGNYLRRGAPFEFIMDKPPQ